MEKEKVKSAVRETIEVLVTAFLLAMLIRAFLIQAFYIPSSSMEPTLKVGDRLFVARFIYWFTKPERGEIIVFRSPGSPEKSYFIRKIAPTVSILTFGRLDLDPHKDYIKRVVAREGETVEVEEGIVYLNGQPLEEPYIKEEMWQKGYGPKKVPPNCLFVLGDNRNKSNDSRYWGFLSSEKLEGKALFIFWPPWRIRIIK
jgi:signal peptidase I